jgi:hypothetical protein
MKKIDIKLYCLYIVIDIIVVFIYFKIVFISSATDLFDGYCYNKFNLCTIHWGISPLIAVIYFISHLKKIFKNLILVIVEILIVFFIYLAVYFIGLNLNVLNTISLAMQFAVILMTAFIIVRLIYTFRLFKIKFFSIYAKQYRSLISYVLILSVMATALWRSWFFYNDPQYGQEVLLPCDNFNQNFSNHTGWTASAYISVCGVMAGDTPVTYIYVHPTNVKERRKFLVFRNMGGDYSKVEWINDDTLLIETNSTSGITKMKSSIGDINIIYNTGNSK